MNLTLQDSHTTVPVIEGACESSIYAEGIRNS